MCSQYQNVGSYNNEIVSIVTAELLGLTIHQFGDELNHWVVYNHKDDHIAPRDVYLVNYGDHYWTFMDNNELPGRGVKAYTSVELEQFSHNNKVVYEVNEKAIKVASEILTIPKTRRYGGRTIKKLIEANNRREKVRLRYVESVIDPQKRMISFCILLFVMKHVGGLIPVEFRNRSGPEQVAEALRLGGNWKKGDTIDVCERGLPFTEVVFKEIFCQGVLSFLF
jgi:hypothetical protein